MTTLASDAMKLLAKAGGFKKKELTWRRRHGETIQVLNVQRSHGNTAREARFYVNVGIAFDALFHLEQEAIPDAPREHECHFRERLEHLAPEAPSVWVVATSTDDEVLKVRLSEHLARAVAFLDTVDGPAKLLQQQRLDEGAELFLRAQLRYVMDDASGALADVRQGVAYFSDRGLTLERQLRMLHLSSLSSVDF
ncbi:DUF4304 domain-containing protein [Myxococcus xanthus]|nr:DUF4304 domain-containing protein [Myxococcus xanthus]